MFELRLEHMIWAPFFDWINWIAAFLYLASLFVFIFVVFYSARTWAKSNKQLTDTVEKLGENLNSAILRLGESIEKHDTPGLKEEIKNNRDAINSLNDFNRRISCLVDEINSVIRDTVKWVKIKREAGVDLSDGDIEEFIRWRLNRK